MGTIYDFFYQKQHLNSYYLMSAFYYRIMNDTFSEHKYISLFNPKNIYPNYEEFILLLYQIYLFDLNNGASKNRELYEQFSEKLNYKLFSKDFLINYFD